MLDLEASHVISVAFTSFISEVVTEQNRRIQAKQLYFLYCLKIIQQV